MAGTNTMVFVQPVRERAHDLNSFSKALAVFSIITYMDTVEGVSFPTGGMHEVARGLAAAAEKAGATLCYSRPVERIDRGPDGVTTGVRLADGEHVSYGQRIAGG